MKRFLTLLAVAALLTAGSAYAQSDAAKAVAKPAAGRIQAEFARNLDAAGDKILQLAQAVPAEKYTWRPAEGVRSFSEAFLHAAGGNYFLTSFTGAKIPEGIDLKTFETSTTKKEEVIAALKKSMEHAKSVANGMTDGDLDTNVKWFLGEASKREILFVTASHAHEHLGQLIAYARMNGITPPWSKKD
ncbi:MAG TPA: DinB family protein [Candidatus Eisenbacteria bacterium]|nr:DinB family protein [Candidatus Eisenbacteria bacterium]